MIISAFMCIVTCLWAVALKSSLLAFVYVMWCISLLANAAVLSFGDFSNDIDWK